MGRTCPITPPNGRGVIGRTCPIMPPKLVSYRVRVMGGGISYRVRVLGGEIMGGA